MLVWIGLGAMAAATGCMEETAFRCAPDVVLPKSVHSHPWILLAEPNTYDASNLHEYINGGARPYIEYGMTQLIHAVFTHKSSPDRRMTVDVYEMASPLAAYGIYSIQRPDQAEDVNLGLSGFWSEGLLCFVKNRIFVSVEPPGEGPRDYASAMLIATYVADHIHLSVSPPVMLSALPDHDRVKRSEKYLAQNMLGHRFLGAGWLASYRYRGVTHNLFVIPCKDSAEAMERYENLASYVSENGKIIRRVKGIGRAALIGKGESVGRLFVACSGKFLAGTTDCFDDDRSVKLSRKLIENVTRMGL